MNIFKIFRKRKEIDAPWKKYYTEEELDIKIPNISMYNQVLRSAKENPDLIAYEYFGKKVTFKKFIKQVDTAAIAFKKMGIKKGSIVSIVLPNVPEALISVYALNKLGAIASMIHPLSSEGELKEKFISTNTTHLVMIDLYYKEIKRILQFTNIEKTIFVEASTSMNPFMRLFYKISQIGKFEKYPKRKDFMSWNKFVKTARFSKMVINSKFGKDTPAIILSSGGTSGKPKNVIIQNRAFVLLAVQAKKVLKSLKVGDRCLTILPNFHGFGLGVCMHTPLSLGVTTILIPQFDAKKFDILFKKTKPNIVLGVPTLYEALVSSNNVKNLDLSSLKYVICGGDFLSSSLENKLNKYLSDHNCLVQVTQGYGMSEVLSAVVIAHDDVNKLGSVGIPLPGNYVKIIDPATRKSVPFNSVGEIVINTKAFMMGYLNNESETNDALQVHDDGHIWLHTGDLGCMDEDGFIFYKGRQKRMIVKSGYNIYPSQIEEVIEAHPAVLQCTVVGVPHPYKHEVPKAFIVLKSGYHSLLVKNQIKEHCKKNLAKHMQPYEIVYRKSLPKTKLGKVDFKALQSDEGDSDE